ncbi:MAG: hypothetical protein U5L45_17835 [Saprospiraceae bacterium]|nr:hypothetical protein [Saprospiraceae bacterium]
MKILFITLKTSLSLSMDYRIYRNYLASLVGVAERGSFFGQSPKNELHSFYASEASARLSNYGGSIMISSCDSIF